MADIVVYRDGVEQGRVPFTFSSGQFPDASNTGVPAGTVLTSSGSISTTAAGQVIQDKNISGMITVRHPNVVIRRCRISGAATFLIRCDVSGASFTVEDCELDGLASATNACGIYGFNWTARRCNIHHCEDGVKMYINTRLEACYIHDLLADSGSHYDGVQIQGSPAGVSNITIVGNTILNPDRSTSAVFIKPADGNISGVTVEGNYLDGGSYTVYNREFEGRIPTGTRVINNHFGRNYLYGPHLLEGTVEFTGNVWADTLEPMP